MSEPEQAEIVAETLVGKFRARGADTIKVLLAVWVGLLTYGLYAHKEEAKESATAIRETNKEVASALKDTNKAMASAIQEGVKAQRFTNCILSTKDTERPEQYMQPNSFCNRVSQ